MGTSFYLFVNFILLKLNLFLYSIWVFALRRLLSVQKFDQSVFWEFTCLKGWESARGDLLPADNHRGLCQRRWIGRPQTGCLLQKDKRFSHWLMFWALWRIRRVSAHDLAEMHSAELCPGRPLRHYHLRAFVKWLKWPFVCPAVLTDHVRNAGLSSPTAKAWNKTDLARPCYYPSAYFSTLQACEPIYPAPPMSRTFWSLIAISSSLQRLL